MKSVNPKDVEDVEFAPTPLAQNFPSKRVLSAQVGCQKELENQLFAQNLSKPIESLSQRFMTLPNSPYEMYRSVTK